MEFTGTYYKCNDCGQIWDYSDLCPDCASENQDELNANDVKKIIMKLSEMLVNHDDI